MSAADLSRTVWDVDTSEFPDDAPLDDRIRFLLRYAILAPSSHNSQPWAFTVDEGAVHLHADESRWLDVADADKRELYLSLGCALENLRIAAKHFGLDSTVEYGDDDADPVVTVRFDAGETDPSTDAALFDAITARRTSHEVFDDRAIPASTLERLRSLVREDEVDLLFVEDETPKSRIAELQVEADERQMADPAYRRELGHWVGIGALGASWLIARIGQVAVTYLDLGEREGAKNSKLIESAPVVAALVTPDDTVETRVRTGQVFERLMLAATAESVDVHPMSQILERTDLKEELAALLGVEDATPQHLFRLGYAAGERTKEHTPRWPLSTVLRESLSRSHPPKRPVRMGPSTISWERFFFCPPYPRPLRRPVSHRRTPRQYQTRPYRRGATCRSPRGIRGRRQVTGILKVRLKPVRRRLRRVRTAGGGRRA